MSANQYYSQGSGSDASNNPQRQNSQQTQQNGQKNRGMLSTILGAAVGGYAGKKLTHDSTLGKITGALLGAKAFKHSIPGTQNKKK